jgi:cell division protein FtsL
VADAGRRGAAGRSFGAMTRFSALVWFMLVLAAGFATFKVKYAVQDIDDQLARARKQTAAEQEEIRVLTAEWTYLAQPERLADLNRRFLGLQPITAKQLQRGIADIPMRAPAAAPDVVVAANPNPLPRPAVPQSAAPNPLPVAPATFGPAAAPAAAQPRPVRLAKAAQSAPPGSLDALIAQIAETR